MLHGQMMKLIQIYESLFTSIGLVMFNCSSIYAISFNKAAVDAVTQV